jgi:predicted nucleic acid-binding protein
LIVLDASVAATAVSDDGGDGRRALDVMSGARVVAPELVDLEVVSAVRAAVRAGQMTLRRALQAVEELALLPIQRVSHVPLLHRIWELRENVSAYEAAYVALAESIGAPLVTADQRLARAPGLRCEVRVLS